MTNGYTAHRMAIPAITETILMTTNHYLSNTLLATPDAADVLDSTPRTLIRWRQEGKGPNYCKIGRKVRYKYSSLLHWVDTTEITPAREALQ